MNIHNKNQPKPITDHPASRSTEQHHGDLRKGAYLKRRAAYQLQAGAVSTTQAGMSKAKKKTPR